MNIKVTILLIILSIWTMQCQEATEISWPHRVHFMSALKNIKNQMEYAVNLNNNPFTSESYDNFNELLTGAIESLSNENENLPNVTQTCLESVLFFASSLKEKQLWALTVLDAFGKPSSGLLQGSIFWLGEYSECKNISVKGNWQGNYCSISKPQQYVVGGSPSLKYGICIPKSCSEEDVASLINYVIRLIPTNSTRNTTLQLNPIDSSYVTCDKTRELDSTAIFAISIFSVLLFCVIAGTGYDLYKTIRRNYCDEDPMDAESHDHSVNTEHDEKLLKADREHEHLAFKILLSFSLYTNTIKLFKITKSNDHLECINAIRFMSIAWVILGHNYVYALSYLDNTLVLVDWLRSFWFMIVSNAFFSVDSFFLLSGLLTAYLFLKETKKSRISVGLMVKYYLHRLWRITPPYALVILFSLSFTKYIGNGPNFPQTGFESPQCPHYWWQNLLYINNFGDLSYKTCLPVAWYLACDMQFHWISPIMLIPLALGYQKIGLFITGFLLIASTIATALIVNSHPLSELGLFGGSPDYFLKIYIAPWCRIGPFLIGILLGYLIIKQKETRFRINQRLNVVLWIASLFLLGLMLFGIYPNFRGHDLPKFINICYQAMSRTLWAIGLSYVIFACLTSNGGFVNKILSWSIWVPLSRLSFSIYLIHTTVLLYYNTTLEHAIHLQQWTMINHYVSNLSFSICAAYFVSMIFEVPIMALEKFIFNRH